MIEWEEGIWTITSPSCSSDCHELSVVCCHQGFWLLESIVHCHHSIFLVWSSRRGPGWPWHFGKPSVFFCISAIDLLLYVPRYDRKGYYSVQSNCRQCHHNAFSIPIILFTTYKPSRTPATNEQFFPVACHLYGALSIRAHKCMGQLQHDWAEEHMDALYTIYTCTQ